MFVKGALLVGYRNMSSKASKLSYQKFRRECALIFSLILMLPPPKKKTFLEFLDVWLRATLFFVQIFLVFFFFSIQLPVVPCQNFAAVH